jgi:subfamily B ATP-binding cassette protein MsbA
VREFLKRFKPYFKDYIPRFVQAGIGVVMVAASTGAVTFLIEYVLDDIFIEQDRTALMVLPSVIIGLYLLQGIGRYAQTYQLAWIGEDIVRRIRNQLLAHVLSLDLAFFNAFRGGELISRITNDINRIRVAVSRSVAVIARESLVIVALIFVAIYKSPRLAFYGLVVLPAAAYPLWWLANRVKGLAHRSQEKDADITARLSEMFNNMEIIKAHHSEMFEAERFERDNLEFRKINMKGVRARELASPLMEFIGSIAVALVIWFGGLQGSSPLSPPRCSCCTHRSNESRWSTAACSSRSQRLNAYSPSWKRCRRSQAAERRSRAPSSRSSSGTSTSATATSRY